MGSLRARFEAKYTPEPNTGCWLWDGACTYNGYGRIGAGGKHGRTLGAHRVAWELYNGPIPQGLQIDHLCRTRFCVNPRHLELVTNSQNIQRGLHCTPKTCKHGHLRTPENTYYNAHGYRSCKTCRREANHRYFAKTS